MHRDKHFMLKFSLCPKRRTILYVGQIQYYGSYFSVQVSDQAMGGILFGVCEPYYNAF